MIVDTSSGPVENLVLHVAKCADARFWFNAPFVGSTLRIADLQPLPVFEKEISERSALIVPLAPGRYTWQIESNGKRTDLREFVLTADGAEVQVSR